MRLVPVALWVMLALSSAADAQPSASETDAIMAEWAASITELDIATKGVASANAKFALLAIAQARLALHAMEKDRNPENIAAYVAALTDVNTAVTAFNEVAAGAGYGEKPAAPTPMLRVHSWRCYRERSYWYVAGRVTNISEKPLDKVVAVATFATRDGDVVKNADALIDFQPLMPGQTSPFTVMASSNPQIERCILAFQFFWGASIPFDEGKPKPVAADRPPEKQPSPASRIRLEDFECAADSGWWRVDGRVTNISKEPIEGLAAIGTFRDKNGKAVSASEMPIEARSLAAGATSRFSVLVVGKAAITNCTVDFDYYSGIVR